MAQRGKVPLILAGAEDPLPSQHLWFEGDGYWIYAAEQPRGSLREHSHDCTEVSTGLEARVSLEWWTGTHSPHRREVSGNMVAVIPRGEPHRALWRQQAILVTIYLRESFLLTAASQILREERFKLEPAHLVRDPLIEELGRALYHEYRERGTGEFDRRFADSVVTVLATHLLRAYNAQSELPADFHGGLGPARERRVRKHIEQCLEGDLSIAALARISGLSSNYFADMFRRTTGFTPHEYVSLRRVDRARQLLTDVELPLGEVAHRCGFKTQSQFTTVFHRLTGVTPGKFRAEHATGRGAETTAATETSNMDERRVKS